MTATIDFAYDVVIVGGGVAGAALAAALAQQAGDARILLVEQAAKAGEINRGDMIWPPHLALLKRWGVLADIEARGAVPFRVNELYDNDGRLLLRHGYEFYGAPTSYGLSLEHPEIEDALLKRASLNGNLTVWRSTRFESILGQDDSSVTVRLVRNGKDVRVNARWLIAADGRGSRVRQEAGIRSELKPYPYEFMVTRMAKDPRWPDTTVQFVGTRGFLGVFLVPGSLSRVVLSLPAGSFPAFMRLSEEDRKAEVVRRAPLLEAAELHWEHTHCYKLAEHHAPAYHKGRVILLGDAAHSFTPMLGMGMNLAMEDAEALAPLLASRESCATLNAARLNRKYEAKRRPRNERIRRQSTQQGNFQVAGGALQYAAFRAICRVYGLAPVLRDAGFRYLFG